jgi:hypothetical protein
MSAARSEESGRFHDSKVLTIMLLQFPELSDSKFNRPDASLAPGPAARAEQPQ